MRCLTTGTLALLLMAAVSSAAGAQTLAGAPRVSGSVTGGLKRGERVTFRVSVVEPAGYRALNDIRISMLVRDLVLAEFTYLPAANSIAIRGGSLVEVGSPEVLVGSFFRFNGFDVKTEASGRTITITAPAVVQADVPAQVDFRFTATNQSGRSATVLRHLNVEEAGIGFGWGTLLFAVLLAMFIGAFVGNLFASRRRGPPKLSVYGAIQRRLAEQDEVKAT
jgi:hypothetical protein